MTIYDLEEEQKFKILRVKLTGEIGKRLADMGFISGATGVVVRSALFGSPLQINLNGCNISLRKKEARGIEVEPL
ncbi:MAG TPA: FeoA family protein [bacterium]|nr:FeoA family protein [bacterium]